VKGGERGRKCESKKKRRKKEEGQDKRGRHYPFQLKREAMKNSAKG